MGTNLKKQVQLDISKVTKAIEDNDLNGGYELIETIVSIYNSRIKNIYNGLTYYGDSEIDVIKDLKILERQLRLYMAEVSDEVNRIPRTSPSIQVSTTNNPSFNNNNHNINNHSMETIFLNTKREIQENESLSTDETEEILAKINEIEKIFKSNETNKTKWSRLKTSIEWLSTKGVDIAIKLLPLILAGLAKSS